MRQLPWIFERHFRSRKLLKTITLAIIVLLCIWMVTLQQTNISELKLAYASLLLPETNTTHSEQDPDAYFTTIRLLNYQLLHDKHTRTTHSIPFIILVAPGVLSWKLDQLAQEEALIAPVENLNVDWLKPGQERWKDVMIKLRLFELTDYNRILFLDADTFLFRPLDAIFHDPAAQPQMTLRNVAIEPDEAPLPESYLFATTSEVMHTTHSYPPVPMSYFNAGFFLMSPSLELFYYYISLLKAPGRFDTTYPEQNLLNYAHRQNGNMPWGRLSYSLNINLPHPEDVRKGVASVHAKLWTLGSELQPIEQELRNLWVKKKEEMAGFYGDGYR